MSNTASKQREYCRETNTQNAHWVLNNQPTTDWNKRVWLIVSYGVAQKKGTKKAAEMKPYMLHLQ
jgi:hypothetical protein